MTKKAKYNIQNTNPVEVEDLLMLPREQKIHDWIHTVFNEKNHQNLSSLYKAIFAQHVQINSPYVGKNIGRGFLQNLHQEWCFALPDLKIYGVKIDVFGPVINMQWKARGTHTNLFRKIPANKTSHPSLFKSSSSLGNIVNFPGEMAFVFEEERVIRYFCQYDILDIYKQLGYYLHLEEYTGQSFLNQDKTLLIRKLQNLSPKSITQREVECLSLYLNGFSAKQIAIYLGISFRTVEMHSQKGLRALDCTNKLECLERMIDYQVLALWQDLGKILLSIHKLQKDQENTDLIQRSSLIKQSIKGEQS